MRLSDLILTDHRYFVVHFHSS